MNKKILGITTCVLALDQISKIIAQMFLELNISKMVIKDFFYLTLCHNDGAAWGIFSGYSFLIIALTMVALLIIYKFIYSFKRNNRNDLAFGFLLGGLGGNLIDRLFLGYVRDFFDFYIFGYDYPVFNVADIFIVVGVILLIIAIIKGEDLSDSKGGSSRRKT